MMASGSAPAHVTTRAQLAELLENAETKYAGAQATWLDVEAQNVDQAKYDEAAAVAETVEDMAIQLMKNYIMAKRRLKFLDNLDGYVVPVDNVCQQFVFVTVPVPTDGLFAFGYHGDSGIWNGVEININSLPNQDNIHMQAFKQNIYI